MSDGFENAKTSLYQPCLFLENFFVFNLRLVSSTLEHFKAFSSRWMQENPGGEQVPNAPKPDD